MKYLYPYECAKKKLSTPAELQAAIDGNRRDSRRTFGPFGSTGGSLSDGTHIFGSSASPPASSSSLVSNHSPGLPSQPSPVRSSSSDEVSALILPLIKLHSFENQLAHRSVV